MQITFEVRQATIDDLDDVAILFNKYRIFYGQPSDEPKARQFLFDRFEHRESIVFIAKDGNRTVGFTQLYPVFSSISVERSLILNDLYVLEEYRKNGVAQLLLDEAKRYGQRIKAKGLALSTAVHNEQAQRLYERNDYVRDLDFYYYFLKI